MLSGNLAPYYGDSKGARGRRGMRQYLAGRASLPEGDDSFESVWLGYRETENIY